MATFTTEVFKRAAPTDDGIGAFRSDFATRISPPDLKPLVDFIHREVAAQ